MTTESSCISLTTKILIIAIKKKMIIINLYWVVTTGQVLCKIYAQIILDNKICLQVRYWLIFPLSRWGNKGLEKEMATHSSIHAWRIPRMGESGGLPSMGSHRVGHDWSSLAVTALGEVEGKTAKEYMVSFGNDKIDCGDNCITLQLY